MDDEHVMPKILWVGGFLDASFVFYLRETFKIQTNTEKILYNESH